LFTKELANPNLKKGIDTLFKFYGDITHTNYIETLKNHSGRFTPLLFLEYIKTTFKDLLEIDFSERTKYNRSMDLLKPNQLLNPLAPSPRSFKTKMTLDDFKYLSKVEDLDDVNTLVMASYVMVQKDALGEDFKQWFKEFKDSKVYKNYILNYPTYNCHKRLKN
jgi:hypothetical protein